MLFALLLATSEPPATANHLDLGKQFFCAGQYQTACQYLEAWLEQAGAQHPSLLAAKAYLGATFDELSRHEEAKTILEWCVENYRDKYPKDTMGLAFASMHLGKVLSQIGLYDIATEHLEKSIRLYKACGTNQVSNLIKANTWLAETYMYRGVYRQAESAFNAMIDQHEAGTTQVLWTKLRLARLYMFMGNYEGAKVIFEEGIPSLRAETNKDKLGWNLFYWGDVYRSLGSFELAEKTMLEGFAAFTACGYEPDHQITQWGQGYFGRLLCDRGQYADAQPILEESLRVHETKYGANSKRNVFIMQALANTYANLGEYVKAENLLIMGLTAYKNQFGDQHTEYALVLGDYGRLAYLQKNYASAKTRLAKALSVFRSAEHPEATRCAKYLQEAEGGAMGQTVQPAA